MNKKIQDVAKELQTDEMKLEVYQLISQFVRTYAKRYCPECNESEEDLISDLYVKFTAPVKHRDGMIYSELDRYSPEATMGGEGKDFKGNRLATYVKRWTICRLMDKHRTANPAITVEADANVKGKDGDAETKWNALDAEIVKNEDKPFDAEDIDVTPDFVGDIRDKYDAMTPQQKHEFEYYYNEHKEDIDPKMRVIFEDLMSGVGMDDEPSDDPIVEMAKPVGSAFVTLNPIKKYGAEADVWKGKDAIRVGFSGKMNEDAISEWKKNMENAGYTFIKQFRKRAGQNPMYYFTK